MRPYTARKVQDVCNIIFINLQVDENFMKGPKHTF